MRDWNEFEKWKWADDKYLPISGEGDTMATQIVTATAKLVYKYFNDGDVYDNTGSMEGWWNDLSSYANWLAEYTDAGDILDRIFGCCSDAMYEDILYDMCERLLVPEGLEEWNKKPKVGSIYDCDGDYKFILRDDDEDDEEDW